MSKLMLTKVIKHYKMRTIDLSKQQALDAAPKAIQQFYWNLSGNNNRLIFFVIEEAKQTILDFSQGTVFKKCCEFFYFNLISI